MGKDDVDLVQITLEFSNKPALKGKTPDDAETEERLKLFYFPHNPSAAYVYNYSSSDSTKIPMKDFKKLTNFFDRVANSSDEILKILGKLGQE